MNALRTARIGLLAAACFLGARGAAAQDVPVWGQAGKTWESAMSQYRSGLYQQAAGLFEEFLKKYSPHEYAGGAQVYLAGCCARLDDYAAWEKNLDLAIRKFPNGGAFFVAYASRLGRLKAQKKNDDYLSLLEAMLRVSKELPLDMTGAYVNTPYGVWYQYNRYTRAPDHMSWLVDPLRAPGMEKDIVNLCDTPARAERALKALALTFKRRAQEMPPEWEFAHVMLLRRAGKTAEADKALKAYEEGWGSDPRGIGLWVLKGEYAQDSNDDKTADEAYAYLVQNCARYGSLSEYLAPRFDYLKVKARYDDFVALAEFYLKEYPQGQERTKVFQHWLALLRAKVLAGEEGAYDTALAVLGRYKGKDSYEALRWLLDVNLETKKSAEALKLADALSAEKYWSSQNFDYLKQCAGRDKGLQKVVDQVRQKYGIPEADPNGPAAALLKQLVGRIKDEQVRHMEEIGDELVQKYPKDAATVEAVKMLADYYFAKLLPEPRDKWIGRMTNLYRLHPLTQAVLVSQATAMNASKRYDLLAATLETLRERFPTAPYAYWMEQRLMCFDAAKDPAGKAAFARKHYGTAADAGDLEAMAQLAKYEVPLLGKDARKIGDYWMEKARKTAGTRGELYCLYWALDGYCYMWTPTWMRDPNRTLYFGEAMAVMKDAQARPLDPEFAWCLEFGDVNVLSEQRDGKAALAAVRARLTEKKYRDLTLRLNLETLATAITRDANTVAIEAVSVGDKMASLCHTQRDDDAINSFLGALYGSVPDLDRAARCYVKIIEDCPWPAKVFGAFQAALSCSRGNPGQMSALTDMYLGKINNLSDLAPSVLFALAYQTFNGNRDIFNAVAGRLAQQYPASAARGQTVRMVLEERERQRKP